MAICPAGVHILHQDRTCLSEEREHHHLLLQVYPRTREWDVLGRKDCLLGCLLVLTIGHAQIRHGGIQIGVHASPAQRGMAGGLDEYLFNSHRRLFYFDVCALSIIVFMNRGLGWWRTGHHLVSATT
jgi:hypothetical protein